MSRAYDPGETMQLTVTRHELGAISNALNEVLHGIEVFEFHARIGATRNEAEDLLRRIGDLYGRHGLV